MMINQNKAKKIVLLLLALQIASYLIYSLLIFTGKIEEINPALWGNFFISSLSFLALVITFVFLISPSGRVGFDRKGNILMAIALIFFFLGDLMWFLDEFVAGIHVPIGGSADLFWNLAYILMIISFFYFLNSFFVESKLFSNLLIALGFFVGIGNFIISLRGYIELHNYSFAVLVQSLYPAYDFVLVGLTLAILIPLIIHRDRIFLGLYVLLAGIVSRVVYDNVFVYMARSGTYYTGHPVDLIYSFFYIAVGMSALLYLRAWRSNK
jgi:hypothetical protein